ncbi:unnamed protein product [Ceratitis capitata]|uniref:(Mediterranean fruit fly) hypothetical protein n=1 Tax=Ceratitis capitata TaxID=7213 RepID=A0A811USL2_CERCA|nr:unnamed protein product [Ceratitis capitata]CAD7001298.1 unnamed protein product [Ceratitis capitata]
MGGYARVKVTEENFFTSGLSNSNTDKKNLKKRGPTESGCIGRSSISEAGKAAAKHLRRQQKHRGNNRIYRSNPVVAAADQQLKRHVLHK